jgi:drug/metabolite transporter (DMT)-like permease
LGKYAFIVATLAFNIAGGYFAKISAMAPNGPLLKYMFLSIACYGSGFLFYIFALKNIPLFIAQSLLSLQYVMMILLSLIVFHEPVAPLQGVGMALIFTGLILVVTH